MGFKYLNETLTTRAKFEFLLKQTKIEFLYKNGLKYKVK